MIRSAGMGIIVAECIDVDRDRFAPVHTGQLRFLEICGHPDVIGLGHEQQDLSGLDPGTQLDASLADDAIGRLVARKPLHHGFSRHRGGGDSHCKSGGQNVFWQRVSL